MNRINSAISLLLLISLAALQSCNSSLFGPDPTTTVARGTILEEGTLKPIENALIEISLTYSSGGLGTPRVTFPIDTVYSDSNGEYLFETEINPLDNPGVGGSFSLTELSHPNYFDGTNQIDGSGLAYLHELIRNAEMIPHAYLNLSLKNDENIEGHFFNVNYSGRGFRHDLSVDSFSPTLDTILLVSGEVEIRQVTKTSPIAEFEDRVIDTIFISAFDTLNVSFMY